MVDRYYRKIDNVENDIENAIQISSILLKLKGYDDKLSDLSKIGNNESNISSNSGKISTNEGDISSNLGKINNIENDLVDFKINYLVQNLFIYYIDIEKEITLDKDNSEYTIFSCNIEDDFKSNSYLEIYCHILYDYTSYDHIGRLNHIFKFYDKNNTLFHEIKFLKTNAGDNLKDNLNQNNLFYAKINDNYSIIKIELILCFLHIPNNAIKFDIIDPLKSNYLCIKHYKKINTLSINNNLTDLESDILSNSGRISTNEGNISSNLQDIETNQRNISSDLGKIQTNEGKISTNEGNISSNLEKINNNKDDILALQNINIKAFYNLDKIFIYDIKKGDQIVSKNNHYHIFEKEIIHNFVKNSYLEIILKVLTEVSNYVLIGFFQILCNFYDENGDLFYTISLSTAMGSINKLSTIKSVFIVPINKNMTKIKINFFIMPKSGQENRSARFIIQDINSNKIYIKYYQKTDEISIKNIQDSINTVNNISSNLEQIDENKDNIASNVEKIDDLSSKLDDSIKSKNIKNILFYDEKEQITFKNYFLTKHMS